MKSDLRAKTAYFKIDGLWLGAWCLDTLLAQPACSPGFSSPVSPDEWYDRPPKPVRGVRCGWEGSWLQQDNAHQGLSCGRGGGGGGGSGCMSTTARARPAPYRFHFKSGD